MHKGLVRLTAELLSDVIVSIRISESCVVQSNRMTILLQQVYAEVYACPLLRQLTLCSPVSTPMETKSISNTLSCEKVSALLNTRNSITAIERLVLIPLTGRVTESKRILDLTCSIVCTAAPSRALLPTVDRRSSNLAREPLQEPPYCIISCAARLIDLSKHRLEIHALLREDLTRWR